MARGKADIKTRLKRQEEKILKMSEQLEKEKETYKQLQEEERREAVKKITEAFLRSKRSVDEVLDFLKGKAELSIRQDRGEQHIAQWRFPGRIRWTGCASLFWNHIILSMSIFMNFVWIIECTANTVISMSRRMVVRQRT